MLPDSAPDTSGTAPDLGASPLLTPDQMARVRRAAALSPYYTPDGNSLRVRVISAVPVTVSVAVRVGLLTGGVFPEVFQVAHPGDRSVVLQDFPLAECLIYNVTAIVTAGTPLVGQTYVGAQLLQASGATATPLAAFIGDVVTSTQPAGWPGSTIKTSVETEPVVRTIVGTTPAPGADILETVPSGARWEVLSLEAVLTEGAGAAATTGYFTLDNGSATYSRHRTGQIGGPTTVCIYNWEQNVQPVTDVTHQWALAPLPSNRMLAGHRIQLKNDNAPAQKTWSAPVYVVREWQEGT